MNKKSLEWLIKSWALDKFWDRKTMLDSSEMLLQWTKSSQQMWGWLFDTTDLQTKITYKNNYETTLMEKLLMDQDVFKTFVSWHPLDGLYYYIKRFSFISQFKGKEKVTGVFIIIWYIKNIQRAKKKWFFVEVEDISGKIEIFMKDTVDLKRNDIVIIHLFKWRSISLEKIVRTSRDLLIQQAWGKYDPKITVVKAKILRLAGKTSNEEKKTELKTIIVEKPKSKEWIYCLPDSIEEMQLLTNIIKNNPGQIKIMVWIKEIFVNEDWAEQIAKLCNS